MKRVLSLFLALVMVMQYVPATVFAAAEDNLCAHHAEHTADCGYAEEQPGSDCTHTHSMECYAVNECAHVHGEECAEACGHDCMKDVSCWQYDRICGHEGLSQCGQECFQPICAHAKGQHDGSCGYAPATEAQPCLYECAECAAPEEPAAEPTPSEEPPAEPAPSEEPPAELTPPEEPSTETTAPVEVAHEHEYTSDVTAPTCAEQGYTTYTCACGDSYVADLLDATGHTYKSGVCTACGETAPALAGKTLSILGASMSTYTGISNNPGYNSTIGNNAVYYTEGRHGVYANDTWWMQVANDLNLRLIVNNSWSGSSLLYERNGTVGAYVDRCVQLHNNEGEMPDIIAIQMGTNDFQYYKDTLGTAEIDYAALITENENGSYTYAEPTTSLEAAAIVLHKISIRYPNAEVYYLNISQRIDGTDELIRSFNAELNQVVEHFGAHIVDIYGSAITMADFDIYIGDGRVHPNCLGMDAYTEAFKRTLLANTAYRVNTRTVSFNLDNVTANYGDDKIVVSGDAFSCELTAQDGKELSVSVSMGGKDITDTTYENGTISIESVTADVVITAEATVHAPRNYRWEFDGTDLACVSGGNSLTKSAGTTTDGIFSKTSYTLENEVVLLHDLPWVVEWKCEGTFLNTNGSSGARIFTSDNVNANYNARYIFKSNTNGIIAMGEKDTKGSHNYGIALKAHNIDWTALHTYRLENRIANDGSNMVYLLVDGEEIGPMNHYYIGTKDQNTTSDWLSGKDFVFPYMGTDTHGFTNASIEFIQVWEGDHSHTYEASVTAPTCKEKGYTTYTCECGDSYVDNYVDATDEHTYENGICTGCGEAHPNLANYKGKVISILGDSISTFAGYIPAADGFNLEHYARYPQDNLLTDVNETWWMQVIHQLDAKLGINESWRSTEVYNYIDADVNSSYDGTKACMASTTRIQNIGSNGTPDVILFFGGTNDITQSRPVGTFDPATAPANVDLTSVKWDTVADAYVNAIMRMQYYYPDAQIVAMLPFDRSSQGTAKVEKYNSLFASICEHYGVPYVDLRECGITNTDLPDGTHPDATGMDYITSAVLDVLISDCKVAAGEHIVHSVTHKLTDAKSSFGYYKGVSNGKPYVTNITGEDLKVTVTMGGVDITDTTYANGIVSVAAVTDDLVITVQGRVKSIYEDHIKQLPESLCCSTNLWSSLVPENTYYTGSAWGNISGNSVYSITIPVAAGDQIWATSFQKSGTNGGSRNGIRLTWFDENGVLESVSPDNVYAEFVANASVTAPDGAVAVNVVMWNGKESNEVYILNRDHCYENGICLGCGAIDARGIWQITENGTVIGAFADLQAAVNACEAGGIISLTENCAVTTGTIIEKDLTIDGGGHLVDISVCMDAFLTVSAGAEVVLRDLALDGGAKGFQVDYDAVTYTNFTIPLVSGSLRDDPRAKQSAIISSGTLICENVDISNRYTESVGGAMQILSGSVSLTECDFIHNYGTSKGGALHIGSKFNGRTEYPVRTVTIKDCAFNENYSGNGGAIYAFNMAEMTITDSVFDSNTANGGKGGAIDLFSETTHPTTAMALGLDYMQTTVRGCRFENNWAGNDGFAIQSYDSDLYLYNSDFIGNVGVHQGSSVGTISTESFRYTDPSQRIYTLMDGCLFEGNKGPCAVYGDHNSISDLDVRNCEFRNNTGKDSFLLYSAVSNITNCRFIGETAESGVIDAIIIENYDIPPVLTLTDVSFTDCTTPAEILTRKYSHDAALQTYNVILQGTTNGDIAIWDNNAVSVQGNHTGNVQLLFDTERSSLTIGNAAAVNGIIYAQPQNAEAPLNKRFCVSVEAEGEGLKYQWYFCNQGSKTWYKSSVRDNTYDDVMTTARAGRDVYCVITDADGNCVTTETAKLICVPGEELAITKQPENGEAVMGERFCVTVEAKGDNLKYQWYFRNKGASGWTKSGVRDNTYDDVMTTARADREIYCVITDAYGNKVTSDTVKLIRIPMKLEITQQPADSEASLGDQFCVTVLARGEGLKYQWYYRNEGGLIWYKSGVRDNTYDDTMTKARMGREVYCVITDTWGNKVTTETAKLIGVPAVELEILMQPEDDSASMGENFCITVEAQGDGLKYQWYFRNKGGSVWYKSGVKDNTYDDVMTKARAGRDVYCVITDAYGNQLTTQTAKIILK